MSEIWKDVVGYEEYFMISNTGKLFSKRTNKILKWHKNKSGYLVHCTRIGGRYGINKCLRAHVLVAEAFIPNVDKKLTVNHIDCDKSNNLLSNLEWATHAEQMIHAKENGLIVTFRGIENSCSKLSEKDVKYIRENYMPYHSKYGARALGRQFGIHHRHILRVINNKSYINVI